MHEHLRPTRINYQQRTMDYVSVSSTLLTVNECPYAYTTDAIVGEEFRHFFHIFLYEYKATVPGGV